MIMNEKNVVNQDREGRAQDPTLKDYLRTLTGRKINRIRGAVRSDEREGAKQ